MRFTGLGGADTHPLASPGYASIVEISAAPLSKGTFRVSKVRDPQRAPDPLPLDLVSWAGTQVFARPKL